MGDPVPCPPAFAGMPRYPLVCSPSAWEMTYAILIHVQTGTSENIRKPRPAAEFQRTRASEAAPVAVRCLFPVPAANATVTPFHAADFRSARRNG